MKEILYSFKIYINYDCLPKFVVKSNKSNEEKIEIGCNNLFRKKCQRSMYDEKLFETFELEAQERHYT